MSCALRSNKISGNFNFRVDYLPDDDTVWPHPYIGPYLKPLCTLHFAHLWPVGSGGGGANRLRFHRAPIDVWLVFFSFVIYTPLSLSIKYYSLTFLLFLQYHISWLLPFMLSSFSYYLDTSGDLSSSFNGSFCLSYQCANILLVLLLYDSLSTC